MAEVLHGNGGGDQLNVSTDKTQVYGLKGNDTLTSDDKRDILLIGGSGDDSLIMSGGNGTLSGGDGSDTFELTYSATKKLSATIEDLDPARDKITVNFSGTSTPILNSVVSGNDVVLSDGERLSVTLKGVRDNKYFDGTGDAEKDNRLFEILNLTNNERENPSMPEEPTDKSSAEYQKYMDELDGQKALVDDAKTKELPWLTLSDDLTNAAQIRAEEIVGGDSTNISHTRPDGSDWSTVLTKSYSARAENLEAGGDLKTPALAMEAWIGSLSHHKNILSVNTQDNSYVDYRKLGVGYAYEDTSYSEHYWIQLFAGSVTSPETVSTAELSTANITVNTIDPKLIKLANGGATYQNTVEDVTILGGNGNDSIGNKAAQVTINGNAGNDFIDNESDSVNIDGGTGNDSIRNGVYYSDSTGGIYSISGANSTIVGGDGNDSIYNQATNVTIDGGNGNDSIGNNAAQVTINAGAGDDSISLGSAATNNLIQYTPGDGSDTIDGFNTTSTLRIGNGTGTYSKETIGSNVIVTVGESNLTLFGAAGLSVIHVNDYTITPSDTTPPDTTPPDTTPPDTTPPDTTPPDTTPPDTTPPDTTPPDTTPSDTTLPDTTPSDNPLLIKLTEGDDNYTVTVEGATIQALGGNDYVYNSRNYANVSIDGGTGDDTLNNYGVITTVNGGAGNDSIYNDGGGVIVLSGAGNDSIYNDTHNVINNEYGYVTISTGAGDDSIYNNDPRISVNGDAGNDVMNVHGWYKNTISGGTGDDSIYIDGSNNDLIDYAEGDGNDSISGFNETSTLQIGNGNGTYSTQKSGDDVIVTVGDGSILLEGAASLSVIHINDYDRTATIPSSKLIVLSSYPDNYTNAAEGVTIQALGSNDTLVNDFADVSIDGGTGDDRISLSGSGTNSTLKYTTGDGNDTVWGGNTETTLEYFAEGEPTIENRGDDQIVNFGTGSVRFVGGRIRPPRIVKGASGTSGGGSDGDTGGIGGGIGGGTSGGGSASGAGNSGGSSSGGTNAGGNGGSSRGRAAVSSSGRTESNRGGNGYKFMRNEHSTTENAPTATSNALPDPVAQLNHQTTSTTQQTSTTQPMTATPSTATQQVYAGGNQVIANYTSGEKIIFGATYTGAFYDGNGNFFAGSTTGALVVQNAADKVIDLTDAAGNSFVKAYSATTAGVIDGRGLAGFEIINGSAGSDAIYAGDDGSQLWGGADSVSDAMMGGNGTDIFIGGRTQGADFFLNASSADVVHLNDSTLSDIVATAEENGTIGIAFNTGNVVAIQSSEALSATVMLADGSAYRFNHANKSWQSA